MYRTLSTGPVVGSELLLTIGRVRKADGLLRLQVARVSSLSRQSEKDVLAATCTTGAQTIQTSAVATPSPASVTAVAPAASAGIRSDLRAFADLSKVRLSSLVVMTSGAGFLMAGFPIAWEPLLAVTCGTTLAAFSANSFNQIYERHSDKLMKRTQNRPLPSGRITKNKAIAWGVGTGAASTAILAAGCNPLTAGLGAANILLYAGVYTPLKRRSEINTWVGSVVGAIPPLMGYAAATGTIMAPEALLAASILYLWQFPHFFALAWKLRKDYARGGHQMVPVNDPTGARTAQLVMRYSMYLAPVPALAYMADITSAMFAVEGTAMNAYLLYLSRNFVNEPVVGHSKKVFLCSLWYLPALLALMVFHKKEDKQQHLNHDVNQDTSLAYQLRDVVFDDKLSIEEKISEVRHRLRSACVHEVLFGTEPSPVKLHAEGLCPVVVGEEIKDTVAETTTKVEEAVTLISQPLY